MTNCGSTNNWLSARPPTSPKSTFLANMSHELRTPLNAIIGYSEMLVEEVGDDGSRPNWLRRFEQNPGGRQTFLLGLINDILDLSKVEAGKMSLAMETFDVPARLSAKSPP